ncbi:flagellar biosynthesis protein FlgA [Brevibacillus sp. SYP-B805]|uniref:flagellar biosynthesis protein FlgA n=1 Tax=Brevibacillus sp. SYP-B805 TaxID=1578199 RepID=UPI0013E9F131|nr:flagellar biosynthesis protein FlgA [Brevibacillus sp. SYP-B805]NGQ96430.1 flagellar biosynthesis protein FlgA [Brevibacillus sp. SYP-B805]
MKKRTLIIISLISFLLALFSFYAATRYIDSLAHEKLFAPVVKVADGREIQPFEPITTEDVVLVNEEADEILPDAVTSLEGVVGKRSVQPIFAGEQVLKQKLDDGHLLPEKGKARYEFPITDMMPVTELRKGDYVKVWVRYRSPTELANMPPPSYFTRTNASAELLFESQLATVKDNNGIEIYTIKPSVIPDGRQIGDTLFHGSEARKYTDAERRYRDYRAQPSSLPAYLGFNLTDQQYRMLSEAMQYGTIQIGHIMVSKEGGTS